MVAPWALSQSTCSSVYLKWSLPRHFYVVPEEVIVSAVSDSGPLGPGEVAIWLRLTSSNPNALISSGNNLDDPFITQSPPSFSLLGN
jgi:hypothetical protein